MHLQLISNSIPICDSAFEHNYIHEISPCIYTITNTWQEALIVNDSNNHVHATQHRMDLIWHYLSTVKAPDNTLCFNQLCHVAKLVLVIPHSNATEERVFSMVRKNKTAFCPSLDPKGTLSSIITIKLASNEPAHKYEPSKDVLQQAKSATLGI